MKLILAPRKYEESMSLKTKTDDVNYIENKFPDTRIIDIGNDSIIDYLNNNNACKKIELMINDPLFRIVEVEYGLIDDGKIAIIEISKTSGIDMVSKNEQNPMLASSYGTGEAIKHALDRGCRNFLIRLDDTATVDAGIGILGALGVEFRDFNNELVELNGKGIFEIEDIDVSNLDPRALESKFIIITKSSAVLSGLMGASYSYAMDKGANKLMVVALDRGLRNYSLVVLNKFGIDIEHKEGAGAGGGIAGSLMTFLNCKFQRNVLIFKDK